jgi:hypothetical protein
MITQQRYRDFRSMLQRIELISLDAHCRRGFPASQQRNTIIWSRVSVPHSFRHSPHLLGRPVRPQPQHPEMQRYHCPQQGVGVARAGHNEMRPGGRTLLRVRLSVRLGHTLGNRR